MVYPFDHVYDETSTNQDIFDAALEHDIWNAMEGYNGTLQSIL